MVVSYFIHWFFKKYLSSRLYPFFRAAGMKCHKQGDLNNRNLLSENSGGWKSRSRHQQLWFLPSAWRKICFVPHSQLLGFCWLSWASLAYSASLPSLPSSSHDILPVCTSVFDFLLFIRIPITNYIINRLRPTIPSHLNLEHQQISYFQFQSHPQVLGVKTSTSFVGTQFNS